MNELTTNHEISPVTFSLGDPNEDGTMKVLKNTHPTPVEQKLDRIIELLEDLLERRNDPPARLQRKDTIELLEKLVVEQRVTNSILSRKE